MNPRIMTRNNIMAGSFLIGSLLLAAWMSFMLGDLRSNMGRTHPYVVAFPLTVGVAGLDIGSDVTLAGRRVGRVTGIHIDTRLDEASGKAVPSGMLVDIVIRRSIALYDDARADLLVPLLGSGATINISQIGSEHGDRAADDAPLLQPGDVLLGRASPGMLAQMGLSSEDVTGLIDSAKDTMARIDAASTRIDNILETVEAEIGIGTRSLVEILANIQALTSKFDGEDGWSARIDTVLTDIERTTAELPELAQDADRGIANATGLIDDARDFLADNRPRLDRTVANLEATTERFRFDTLDQIGTLMQGGRLAVASYTDLADELNLILDREQAELSAIITNARILSETAKLTLEELRAQPWRVLKPPSKEVLEREPLYNAARAYAAAVSDLRAASEALESVVARVRSADGLARGLSQIDPSSLEHMTGQVEAAFERYQSAELELLKLLGG